MRDRLSAIFISGVLLAFPSITEQKPVPSSNADRIRIERILDLTGAYCERLKAVALHFVCRETIKETPYEIKFIPAIHFDHTAVTLARSFYTSPEPAHTFVYDYQMIKKEGVLDERRDLIEEDGKKREEKNVALKTSRMSSKFLVYGPVGFLSRNWQPHFDYQLAGTERVLGRRAVILKASPGAGAGDNHSAGRLWIDEASGSILQIEWEPSSIPGYSESVSTPAGDVPRRLTWTVVFGVEKNGIRFPSVQAIKEIYVSPSRRKQTRYEAEYRYDQYRFFTVETEIVYTP